MFGISGLGLHFLAYLGSFRKNLERVISGFGTLNGNSLLLTEYHSKV
jgi:hypothetical protein